MRRGRESSIATSSRHRAEPASRAGQLAAGFGGVGGPEESSLWIASQRPWWRVKETPMVSGNGASPVSV
jgi:hypothetical protein